MADTDQSASTSHKGHRKRQAGPKYDKQNKKKSADASDDPRKRNPKAFAYHSVNKVAKAVRRTLDIKEKKHHIPVVDRTPVEPPPVLVAVVGPPKVGKTTLINSLLKNFTRQKITSLNGPVTIVSGKKRRLTFLECNNDINSMIDVAKVADLVLLLIDASFGFEMEIFEFLNICQVHGFPRIMGVLTHLDYFKDNKQLRNIKRRLKHRFWTEVYQGAKLFFLSGTINGEYQRTEVHNLGRFISVMKFRPLQWRTTHAYVLVDRLEDVTSPESIRQNPKCDRQVCFYGYVRGTHMPTHANVHIPGAGDFTVQDLTALSDPCPLPECDVKKRRVLTEKHRLMYAPMSGVGGILYDKDATYIDLGGSHSHGQGHTEFTQPRNELMASLAEARATIDEKMTSSGLSLFADSAPITSVDEDSMMASDEEVDDDASRSSAEEDDHDLEDGDLEEGSKESGDDDVSNDSDGEERDSDGQEEMEYDEDESADESQIDRGPEEDTASSEPSQEEGLSLRWKEGMARRAAETYYSHQNESKQLQKLVYDAEFTEPADDERTLAEEQPDARELHGGLFVVHSEKQVKDRRNRASANEVDCSRFKADVVQDWSDQQVADAIRDCFVTGTWDETEDAQTRLDKDDEVYGSFEDYETGQNVASDNENESGKSGSGSDQEDDDASGGEAEQKGRMTSQEKRAAKKARIKAMFDAEYDAAQTAQGADGTSQYFDALKDTMAAQSQLNRAEFEDLDDSLRAQYEGLRPGLYVRAQVGGVSCELVTHHDPAYPVILGALQPAEQNVGHVQVRLKKHRWHKRILKTRDPLIVSVGWRRFQTMPLYSIQDHNMRHRALKYTPQHLHCHATFQGPITPQGTGILAVQSTASDTPDFRVSATGVVVELDKSITIVKKLKLTGTPLKIYKKTAFIQGMFTSALEVAKFEGMSIKTVSGIRGQIKKAARKPEGAFRATFEDKILLSDIVFARTWFQVQVPQFYNPVTTLMLAPDERKKWQGMKTSGQLRREKGMARDVNKDHLYRKIERPVRQQRELKIPRSLQNSLPFKDKPKVIQKARDTVQAKRVAVVREARERKVAELMKTLGTLHAHKMKIKRATMRARAREHNKVQARIDEKKDVKVKQLKKNIYRSIGKAEKREQRSRK